MFRHADQLSYSVHTPPCDVSAVKDGCLLAEDVDGSSSDPAGQEASSHVSYSRAREAMAAGVTVYGYDNYTSQYKNHRHFTEGEDNSQH